MVDEDERRQLEQWQIEKLVDSKIEAAIAKYDDALQKALVTMFLLKLSKFESAYNVGKFVVAAVLLLVIGTVYQLFVSLANLGGVK